MVNLNPGIFSDEELDELEDQIAAEKKRRELDKKFAALDMALFDYVHSGGTIFFDVGNKTNIVRRISQCNKNCALLHNV